MILRSAPVTEGIAISIIDSGGGFNLERFPGVRSGAPTKEDEEKEEDQFISNFTIVLSQKAFRNCPETRTSPAEQRFLFTNQ